MHYCEDRVSEKNFRDAVEQREKIQIGTRWNASCTVEAAERKTIGTRWNASLPWTVEPVLTMQGWNESTECLDKIVNNLLVSFLLITLTLPFRYDEIATWLAGDTKNSGPCINEK